MANSRSLDMHELCQDDWIANQGHRYRETEDKSKSNLKDYKEILHNKYISIMCLSIRVKGLPDKLSPILIFR